MSLPGLIRGAISGKNTWADVGEKIKSLLISNVVDPLEEFGKQFLSDFGKAALQEAAVYGPQIAADLAAGNASQIPALIPVIAVKLEQDGIKIAETDAAQDATQIIGNALRVQATSIQIAASPSVAPHVPVDPAVAASVGSAVADAGASVTSTS